MHSTGTSDELVELLEQYQQYADAGGVVPDNLAELLAKVKNTGEKPDNFESEEILPEPGFVVKTSDEAGVKVFINICHSPRVAAPGGWESGVMPDNVQAALDNVDGLSDKEAECLRFPISMGELKMERDKRGEECTVLDCVFNSDVLKQAAQLKALKVFVINLAMNWVTHKHRLELDPKFKLPKMLYKGSEISKQRIRVDPRRLVSEMRDLPEQPNFPLLASKPKAQQATAGAKATSRQGSNSSRSGPGKAELSGSKPATKAADQDKSALLHTLEFEGKPVERMLVRVCLPDKSQQWPAGITASMTGMTLSVAVSGYQPLSIALPFAVSVVGSEVCFADDGALLMRLEYQPVGELLEKLRAALPHNFGSLPLHSDQYLELEPESTVG